MSQPFTGDYFLSLPERFIRSAAAITGGTSLFLTRSLLPDLVRESTTYQVTIGDMQRFLISRIAQVDSQFSPGIKPVSDDYIYHKMAGNVLELASFMAVRFSPVWAFAIISDVAGGSSSYFERLLQQLKAMEILDQDADLYNIQDILESIQKASSTSARAIDRPPLSQAELGKIVDELRSDYRRLGKSGLNLMPQVEEIQDQMERVSEQEGISQEELGSVMALRASSIVETGRDAAVAVGKTTGELIDEQIFESYARTLNEISKVGLPKYAIDNLEPFIKRAIDHLNPGRTTWTERKLAEFM